MLNFLGFFNILTFCTKLGVFSRISSSDAQLPRVLTYFSPSALQSLSFTGILLGGFHVFAFFAQDFSSSNAGVLGFPFFCSNIFVVCLGIFHCGPKMAMGRPVQGSKHTGTCTHTSIMVPAESAKYCKNSNPKQFFVSKTIFTYSKISVPEFAYVRRFFIFGNSSPKQKIAYVTILAGIARKRQNKNEHEHTPHPATKNIAKSIRPEYVCVISGGDYSKMTCLLQSAPAELPK